jgi:hypothetical protein
MWRPCGDFPASVVFKSFTLFRTFHFLSPTQASPKARVETIRLTRAVKNAWAGRFFWRFEQILNPQSGVGEAEKE